MNERLCGYATKMKGSGNQIYRLNAYAILQLRISLRCLLTVTRSFFYVAISRSGARVHLLRKRIEERFALHEASRYGGKVFVAECCRARAQLVLP
jgi:hypothetical protein